MQDGGLELLSQTVGVCGHALRHQRDNQLFGGINGEEGASRTDYNATEDDNVTVQGVSGSPNAIGYFGFSYYEENADALKAERLAAAKGGSGAPTAPAALRLGYGTRARAA